MRGFGGEAAFVSENYGASALARKFGVTRYPAIFVDDILVATPSDFGFYGKGETQGGGRYAPLKSAASHERLRSDLTRMIQMILAGRKEAARALAAPSSGGTIAALPSVTFKGLDGEAIPSTGLEGRVVLVEMWATWCVPCRGTLGWLGELKKRHGSRLSVVTIAIQSEEPDVRQIVDQLRLPFVWTMGDADLVRAFGDVSAVPTLLVFDTAGGLAAAYYGAPPTLHAEAEAKIAALLR